ncbi:hypothetical protein KIH39_19405 [Telmatocola sphagniphila]|uniref:Uncharacterized protein n=1 Tax=Telmatocola sphagniphila TaxID=1123043 RepID=A0A8E6EX90_9BACT|nr:hypothetical protein [Telmatocola sphagniphila]QVL31001.1 hypothetical protein KIH39_19405 [Telmatocola sphagniphila]
MTADFGSLLCTRTFTWVDDLATTRYAYLDISMPVNINVGQSNYWACNVRTRDTGEDDLKTAQGDDSVQAIYHALILAGIMVNELTISSAFQESELENFGFPSIAIPNEAR